jgi:hypothetical protein
MQSKITKFLIAVAVFIFSLMSFAEAQSEQDAYRTEVFSTSASPDIEISTSGGFVHVYGHDADEVKVLMFVRRGRSYLSPSETDLSEFDIVITQSGNNIIATSNREGSGISGWLRGGTNISVSFEVYMPEGSRVNARTSGGSVKAENIKNELSLRTSGGSVTATNIHGKADLSTSGGSITLNDLSGLISASTSGGTIRANSVVGEAELRTSGGSIRLENIDAKLSARTSGGSINAKFTRFDNDIELRTSGGSIRIDIPSTEHFEMDLTGNRVNTQLRNFTGTSERNRITGIVGTGGPKISARTSGGSVQLNYH